MDLDTFLERQQRNLQYPKVLKSIRGQKRNKLHGAFI